MNIFLFLLLLATGPKDPDKVYICKSPTSYAYHIKFCEGLQNATHKIDTVSLKEAKASGHDKPCGFCFKLMKQKS
jgi:hypothetical protein